MKSSILQQAGGLETLRVQEYPDLIILVFYSPLT